MSTFVLCVGCGTPLYGFSPCRWCTCERCGNDLRDGFCSLCNLRNSCVYDPNPNSFDCPPNSCHPPHPTYETYSGDSCGNDSHFGYDCPPQFPLNYEPEPAYIQNYTSYPHDSSSFSQQYCANCGGLHETFQCQPTNQNFYNYNSLGFDQPQPPQSPVIHQPPQELSIQEVEDLKQQYLDELEHLSNLEYRDEIKIAELIENFNGMSIEILKKEKLLQQEQWAYLSTHPSKRLTSFCYDDDEKDYNSAITPVLSTEETDNSLSMRDEHLDTIQATESDEVIKSSVEDLVPIPSEFEDIPNTMCDMHLVNNPTPLEAKDHFEIVINSNNDISSSDDDSLYKENIEYVEASPHDSELVSLEAAEIVIPEEEEIEDDNLREQLLNVHLLIANTEALKDNPTPSFKLLTKSSSTSPKSFLEETNTFHNSLPEFENFYFDLEEISSGSTTTHSDISLSEYDSFTFDLSNNQCPLTDRSDFTHKEFADELAHIISPPEYDCFYFRNLPHPGELISIFNSRIRENLSTTHVNLPIEDDHSPLLAYVVWIFLAYLTYLVIPPYLHSFGNEDTIFDPGITINRVYSFKPGLSHRCGAFKKFNTHRSHLNECPMIINGKNTPILDILLFHFYPP
uniref:Pre-mRNA splicing Prp18-interacting factor n=1 Tax=Tanacetum cinerariifolium TaxID=118510 RepID=A0A6L2NG62_TANCI|nr:hypothetical protein [Tanacetum cinerariifolium]